MPVGDESIFPAVIVQIEKFHSEAKKGSAHWTKVRWASQICELAVVIVVKQIVHVVGEICLGDVRPSIVVVVRSVDAHTSLFAAIRAVCHTRLHADFSKAA